LPYRRLRLERGSISRSNHEHLDRFLRASARRVCQPGPVAFFALLAERYERKSVMITSNLVFSKWDQIFKDPMTTMGPWRCNFER
jgi:IstB-like ATP binding protein.